MVPLGEKGKQLLGILWFESVLAFSIITIRWYTRRFVGGSLGWDDWILMATWCLMCAFAAICTVAVMHGMGVHASELSMDEDVMGMKYLLIGQSVISIAMGTSKCAVAVFMLRIVNKLWHKALLWAAMVSMMALSILLSISVFAQCTPVQSIWDSRIPKEACPLNLTVIAKILCAWSAAIDFFLALFPWIVIWGLNMKRKEKVTVCISLSLGIFAGACGIVRTTGLDALSETADYLYAVSDSVMWTMSELTLTIICICIPALRPLYNRIRGYSSSGGGGYYEHTGPSAAGGKSSNKDAYDLSYMPQAATSRRCEVEGNIKDSDSDRSILGEQRRDKPDVIQRVQEVAVSYENAEGVGAKQLV